MMLLSLVITSWDDGSTSYNFAPFPEIGGEKIISGFLRNGEQVYRVIYDLYSKVYQYYYVFTLKTLEFRYSQLLNFGEHLTKAISSKKVLPKDVWRFLEYLKIDTSYFEDVFAVRPKEIPEYVIDDVNLYIEKYYQS